MKTVSPHNPKAHLWHASTIEGEILYVRNHDTSYQHCKQAHIDWIMGIRRWLPITEAMYYEWMNVLPPEYHSDGLVVSSECWSGDFYPAVWNDGYRCWFTHVTIAEAKNGKARRLPRAYDMEVIREQLDESLDGDLFISHDKLPRGELLIVEPRGKAGPFGHFEYEVYAYNGVPVGQLCRNVDGYLVFWPDKDTSGYWDEGMLEVVTRKLNILNQPWEKNVRAWWNGEPKDKKADATNESDL